MADVGAKLSPKAIAEAVGEAGFRPLAPGLAEKFSIYFELLQKWNAKLNLTAIRTPAEVLQRHFVECMFCAQILPEEILTFLDYGSGGGFPGVPVALCRPEMQVTLAESQGKKAGFLREAVRTLGISAEVYSGRVEQMARERVFDAVALRAVDRMQEAVESARQRVAEGGWLVLLCGAGDVALPAGFSGDEISIPGSDRRVIVKARRPYVPRGT